LDVLGFFVVLNKNKYSQFIMGVLDKAKNGDKQFWNIEISCSQWEGLACTQSALIFKILSFVWVGGGFFTFFLCSQHVPFKFPMASHQAPMGFPICSLGSQCVPQYVPQIAHHIIRDPLP
jgi:hypothetical protein